MKRIEAIRQDRAAQRKMVLDRVLVRLVDFAEPLGLDLVPFGSYAKGRVRSQSDLDLAIPGIVSDDARNHLEREAERVEADEGVSIDLMFETEIPTYFTELRDSLSVFHASSCPGRRETRRRSNRKSRANPKGYEMNGPSPESPLQGIQIKLDRISFELGRGDSTYRELVELRDNMDPNVENEHEPQGLTLGLALIVHHLYNGIEQILEDIAKIADNFDQSGKSSHADLIDIMATNTPLRPAILTPELRAMLHDLRKFRHVVRHSYGNPLVTKKVMEKFTRFREIFWPRFEDSLSRVMKQMKLSPNSGQGEKPMDPDS